MKLFEDMVILENQLEIQRKRKIKQINIKDLFKIIDHNDKGYAIFDDYLKFFEEFYNGKLPISQEEIRYLFKRHDKEGNNFVKEIEFLKELLALEEILLI